ncbi:hypothetical protein ACWF94_09145 [Streptomyces sp. NPDC055078]
MTASAHLLLDALSTRVSGDGQAPAPRSPGARIGRPAGKRGPSAAKPSGPGPLIGELPGSGPLTSEPPLPGTAPLTSEPPFADHTPLTSEPTAARTADGTESPGV